MKKSTAPLQSAPQARPSGRSARVGQDVMEATIAILTERGSHDVTFEQVAEKAGVNRTTLYRRWKSKSRLIAWAMLEFMDEQIPQPDAGNIRDDLVDMLTSINTFMGTPLATTFFQVMGVEARTDKAIAEAARDYWDTRSQLFQKVISRAIERGELAADTDADRLSERVFGPFYFRLFTRAGRFKKADLAKIVDSALGPADN